MQSKTSKTQRLRGLNRLFAVIVCASLMLSSIAAAPFSLPDRQTEAPAAPAVYSDDIPTDSSRVNFHRIIFKFNSGADAALEAQGLVSASGVDLSPVQQTLQGLEVRPLFSTAAQATEKLQASSASNGAELPAFSQYFYAELPNATFEESQAVLAKLLADPTIEDAHMEPIYTPATNAQLTDDITSQQGYLNPSADGGLDALYAWTINGGRGLGVQLIDIEEGWQIGHEDLPLRTADLIESRNSSNQEWVNHGAAVAGIVAGLNNGRGITGIASDTHIRMVSSVDWLTPDAILKAATYSQAGDIILISQQALGPASNGTCPDGCNCSNFESIPVEYWQENFDAISAATSLGIIVVEAAGNGAMDLDATRYGSRFNRSTRNSGALLVGAGTPDTVHAPVCDANYGKRVDLQGWGASVVTTGYGDLDEGDGPNQYYTANFGGSSSASAMVAGAVSSLQGIAKRRGYLLSPSEIRSILRSTGVAQGDVTEHNIGPFPNLHDAITLRLTSGVVLLSPPDNSTVRTLYPTLVWQAYFNASMYQLQVSTNSSFSSSVVDLTTSKTEVTLSTKLSSSVPVYFWRVRPFVNDVWENWTSNVFHFSVAASSSPAVTLSKPANNALVTDAIGFTPEFIWKQPSTIPDGYEIQISTNYDFNSGLDATVTETSYIPPAPGLNPNSRYYWRVRSYMGDPADDGSFGPWSGRRILYTSLSGEGMAPLNIAANEDTLRPTFEWSSVTDAKAYQLQVSKVETFKSIALNATISMPSDSTTVPTTYTPGKDLPRAMDLYWRVRVKGLYGWSAWSALETFTTPNPPGTPKQYTPGNKAATNTWETGTLFTWSKPGKYPESYHIQIATDKKFENIVVEEEGIAPPEPDAEIRVPNFIATGLEAETTYYWRVRAAGDGYSNWSAVRILYTTPPAPTGLDLEASDSLRPTFTWEKVEVARSYQLQVARDNPDTPDEEKYKLFSRGRIVASVTTLTSPPYTITTTLPRTNPDTDPDKSFLWRVRAGGLHGYGAWSEIASLTTPNPPNAPTLVAPSNGANLPNFSPTLDWNASAGIKNNPGANAVGYQLQVSNRSNFAVIDTEEDVLIDLKEEDISGTAYRIGLEDLPKAGTYYWHVRAVNENGEYSVWSQTRWFNTPGIVSGQVTDALTGDGLPNVTIQVSGRAMQTTTDAEGNYVLRGMPAGNFNLVAATSGYIRQTVNVTTGYTTNRTRNIALAPLPAEGEIRIVLNWGGSPANMDAHLWLPPTNKAHVYVDNMEPEGAQAVMDRADDDGYGPEIITLSGTFSGTYRFAAYTGASSSALASSRARIAVYYVGTDGTIELLSNIAITDSGTGHWWNAFTMDGTTRKVTVQNTITDTNPAPYPDLPTP